MNQTSCTDNANVIPYNLTLYRTGMEEKTERWGLSDCWKIQENPGFIYSSSTVCFYIQPPFYYAGEDVVSLLMIFLFSPPFTVNKSCPVLTRCTCHQWRLPFHRVILEHKSNSHFSIAVTFLRLMSRCSVGRGGGGNVWQERSWLRTWPGFKSRIMGFFPTIRAPLEGHVRQQMLRH